MWLPFLIGSAIGYALIAAGQWVWSHRVGTAIFLAFCMILGLAADAVDALRNGTVAERTTGMSVTVLDTFEDFSRYEINGEHAVRVRISNPTVRTLRSFEATCGDFDIYDENPVAANSGETRTYSYIDTSKRSDRCRFDDAVVA